jgi:hypothetical protein
VYACTERSINSTDPTYAPCGVSIFSTRNRKSNCCERHRPPAPMGVKGNKGERVGRVTARA